MGGVRQVLAGVVLTAAATSACGAKITPLCAPHDLTCQSQMGNMNDPSCKNGTAANGKCLDPRAPE